MLVHSNGPLTRKIKTENDDNLVRHVDHIRKRIAHNNNQNLDEFEDVDINDNTFLPYNPQLQVHLNVL